MNEPRTLIDKLWSSHEIVRRDDGASLLLVDRHYVHEGSFHAFSQMKERRRTVAEPGSSVTASVTALETLQALESPAFAGVNASTQLASASGL